VSTLKRIKNFLGGTQQIIEALDENEPCCCGDAKCCKDKNCPCRVSKQDTLAVLRITLDEQRRMYEGLLASVQRSSRTALVYVGVIFTALMFMFQPAIKDAPRLLDQHITGQLLLEVADRLSIPDTLVGLIFWVFAVACVIYSIFHLCRIIFRGRDWMLPVKTINHFAVDYSTPICEEEFLKKEILEYKDVFNRNNHVGNQMIDQIKTSFAPAILGLVILIIMRVLH